MKRIPRQQDSFHWKAPCVSLNRTDLERIIALLEETKGDGVVVLKDDEATYESLDDLKKERGVRPSHIILETKITVDIPASDSLTVSCNEQSLSLQETARKIKEYLETRRRTILYFLCSRLTAAIVLLTIAIGPMLFVDYDKWLNTIPVWSLLLVFVTAIPALKLGGYYGRVQRGKTHNISLWRDYETFGYRHAGTIVENVIRAFCGLVGGLIGAGIVYGIQRMFAH